jgi:hypothetical protein
MEEASSTVPWVNIRAPFAMQTLPMLSIYTCPRCRQLTSQRNAIRFGSGLHYITIVQCGRCININKSFANIASGFPCFQEPAPK